MWLVRMTGFCTSQVFGWADRLWNDLWYVEWDVTPYDTVLYYCRAQATALPRKALWLAASNESILGSVSRRPEFPDFHSCILGNENVRIPATVKYGFLGIVASISSHLHEIGHWTIDGPVFSGWHYGTVAPLRDPALWQLTVAKDGIMHPAWYFIVS